MFPISLSPISCSPTVSNEAKKYILVEMDRETRDVGGTQNDRWGKECLVQLRMSAKGAGEIEALQCINTRLR